MLVAPVSELLRLSGRPDVLTCYVLAPEKMIGGLETTLPQPCSFLCEGEGIEGGGQARVCGHEGNARGDLSRSLSRQRSGGRAGTPELPLAIQAAIQKIAYGAIQVTA